MTRYKNQKTQTNLFNSRLSLGNNLERKPSDLQIKRPSLKLNDSQETVSASKLKTVLKQNLLIYTSEDKFLVDPSTAYSLNLINLEGFMNGDSKYLQLPSSMLLKLQNNKQLNIEYQELEVNKNSDSKKTLEIFKDNDKFFINNSAAYALNLISTEQLMSEDSELHQIYLNTLLKFQDDPNILIEYHNLIKDRSSNKLDNSNFNIEDDTSNYTFDHSKRKNILVHEPLDSTNINSPKSQDHNKRKILLDLCKDTKLSDLSTAKNIIRNELNKDNQTKDRGE